MNTKARALRALLHHTCLSRILCPMGPATLALGGKWRQAHHCHTALDPLFGGTS